MTITLILASPGARAGTVNLAWNASSGSVAGYRVYYGQTSGSYTSTAPTAPSLIGGTSYTTPDLPAGTYYFAVKAFDSAGNSSGYSNEVVKAITAAPAANFSASPVSGTAPLAVAFTDSSTNATAWSWNFGDGTTSTTRNPSKTYSSVGYLHRQTHCHRPRWKQYDHQDQLHRRDGFNRHGTYCQFQRNAWDDGQRALHCDIGGYFDRKYFFPDLEFRRRHEPGRSKRPNFHQNV
ncbi:MAG: PKD domain-containing protein [Candidatus Competibacter sp.]